MLIAEDDREMRCVLVETLAMDGHEVYDVGDGAALLTELASNNRFHFRAVDVVVADVRMPLCSGLDALETIRGIPLDLRFILLSAFADAELHARVEKLDAVLLDKPVSMSRLRAVVTEQIRHARAVRSSAKRQSAR